MCAAALSLMMLSAFTVDMPAAGQKYTLSSRNAALCHAPFRILKLVLNFAPWETYIEDWVLVRKRVKATVIQLIPIPDPLVASN